MNNRNLYGGRDPYSCGNIAWVFGLWYRAWDERDNYGKVRTMTAAGLDPAASDPEAYVLEVELTGLEARR